MTTIQLRRGSSRQWAEADPVLAAGEPGWDLDARTLKIGDGARRWSELPAVDIGDVAAQVAAAVARSNADGWRARHLSAWEAAAAWSSVAPVRVLFLGSSTTYGNNASVPASRFVNQTILRAQAQFPAAGGDEAEVRPLSTTLENPRQAVGIQGINGSAGGVTSAQYCPAITLWAAQQLGVAFAVHMVGSNDSVADLPISQYRANVRAAVEGLAARGVGGQLLVHTYRRHGVTAARWAEYAVALAEVAAGVPGVSVLDVSELFEQLSHLDADPLHLIDQDKVHMTDAGHALMGEQVARALGVTARPRGEARPAPRDVPVGTVHVDPASGVPLFSTGSAWVDATGQPG